jgi:hypothetical protein
MDGDRWAERGKPDTQVSQGLEALVRLEALIIPADQTPSRLPGEGEQTIDH